MKNKIARIALSFLYLVVVLAFVSGQSTSSSNYANDIIISSGGSDISSSNYNNDVVVGTITGELSSSSYTNQLGFFFGAGAILGSAPLVNNAPDDPTVSLTSADGSDYSNQNLNCVATITDSDSGDLLNVTVKWYNNGSEISSASYNNQANGTSFTGSLASSSTSAGDVWMCSIRLFDGQDYSNWANSLNLTILETPAVTTIPSAGAGGGGTGTTTPSVDVSISPEEINVDLIINRNKEQVITITNLKDTKSTIKISQENLDKMVIFEDLSIELEAGESKDISIVFVALEKPGIYTGKIIIGNKEVLVSLNIRTRLLLFDSNIVVLNRDYKVNQGKELKTQITLIPMGDKDRLDVTLNYVIKDYSGKVYLTKSETLLVEEQIDFERDFGTGMLPIGEYIVGLELIYPNGVAPSSAHFEVVEKIPIPTFKGINIYLIIGILFILILIVILLIRAIIKNRKKYRLLSKKEEHPKEKIKKYGKKKKMTKRQKEKSLDKLVHSMKE